MTMTAAAGEEPRKGRGQETRPTEVKARRDRLDQAKPRAAGEEPDAAFLGLRPLAGCAAHGAQTLAKRIHQIAAGQDRPEALCHPPIKAVPAAAGAKESAQEELDQDEQRRLDEISEQKAHFPVPRTFVYCNKGLKVTFVPRLAHPDMYSGLAWIRNRCGGRGLTIDGTPNYLKALERMAEAQKP
jgi:hypothetical protein